jgi:hypothetical protein
VAVSWSVTDDESDITSESGCAPTTVSADTPGLTLTCSAASAGGTSSHSVTVKRDATAPVVAVTGVADGATYITGAVPAAGCSTTDALSGVATSATVGLVGSSLGGIIVRCTGATDNAGNTAHPVSVTYTVVEPAPPVLVVNATGTLPNLTTGTARISGTATCATATMLTVSLLLVQQQGTGPSAKYVTGRGSVTIACKGATATAWAATLTPVSGKFAAGKASATASAPKATSVTRAVTLK